MFFSLLLSFLCTYQLPSSNRIFDGLLGVDTHGSRSWGDVVLTPSSASEAPGGPLWPAESTPRFLPAGSWEGPRISTSTKSPAGVLGWEALLYIVHCCEWGYDSSFTQLLRLGTMFSLELLAVTLLMQHSCMCLLVTSICIYAGAGLTLRVKLLCHGVGNSTRCFSKEATWVPASPAAVGGSLTTLGVVCLSILASVMGLKRYFMVVLIVCAIRLKNLRAFLCVYWLPRDPLFLK